MATVVSTLYPPVVSTFQNAFVNTEDAVVYFTLSSFNSASEIKHVHVSCVNQLNNENALNKLSGILIEDLQFDKVSGMYYVTIPTAYIEGNAFNTNQFYKVQIRFDSYNGTDEVPINDEVKKNSYLLSHTQYFSEWSSVCLIRPIHQPKIYLSVFENYTGNSYMTFNKGLTQIAGGLLFVTQNESGEEVVLNTETETLEAYQFDILDDSDKVLFSTPTIYTGENINPNNIVYNIDFSSLKNSSDGSTSDPTSTYYVCRITCRTKNQYQLSKEYKFQIGEYTGADEWQPTIAAEVNDETASIRVSVKNEYSFSDGVSVYVRRASNKDNFKEWETIYSAKLQQIDFSIVDNTVESLTWYRYRVEALTSTGMSIAKPIMSKVVLPQFYDAYFSRGKEQYAVRYNYQVSSFKPVVNRAKIDTLGGKYPKFAENAVLNYKQFSISGMISAESDVYSEFADKTELIHHNNDTLKDLYSEYKDETGVEDLIRNDFKNWQKTGGNQYPNGPISSVTSQEYLTTTTNDWLYEREFREKLIAWLNDGEPKLYRSMAEGSMVVMLTDVTLTPNSTVGRRLWNFSATVYEVEDASSLDTLDTLGIYNRKMIGSINGGGKQDSEDDPKDYIEVIKPAQMYKMTVTNNNDIRNDINDTLSKKYSGVLSGSKAEDIVLKNVKIFYHSKPRYYTFQANSDGLTEVTENTNGIAEMLNQKQVQRGYYFGVITRGSDGNHNIFVNERGYYQIPNKLDVTGLYFQIGDVVTVEYTLCYKERSSAKEAVSGASIDRTLVGQESGVFKPNAYLGNKIRNKYNFIQMNGDVMLSSKRMKYWKGICLDVTPYAVASIKYHNEDEYKNYLVGGTGVLHMLKDVPVDDICFLGIRMKLTNKKKYLQENEFRLDSSVGASNTTALNWFTIIDNTDTKQPVSVIQDEQEPQDSFSETWNPIGMAVGTQMYNSKEEIKSPVLNTVYNINNELKLYYNYQWYNFAFASIDTIDKNTATERIGIAAMPVEGMINYYGTVMTTNYQ